MDVSVIGLAGSGKTTLMEAMSGLSTGHGASRTGLLTVRVPDYRVGKLSDVFKPKKTTYAEFRLQEVPWVSAESTARKSAGEKYIKNLQGSQLLLHVIRNFQSPYHKEPPDPARDIEILDSEMLLADMVICENFFDRSKKAKPDPNLAAAMERAKAILENESFLVTADLTDVELKLIGGFGFSTLSSQLIVVNSDEDQAGSGLSSDFRNIIQVPLLLAKEVSELPIEEQADFLADLGIDQPLVNSISRESYKMMNLISFFTVGDDEVRAWTIKSGTGAQKAAGKIHSDLERGFIRAEVVGYDTFMELGSLKACKEKGLLKAEGKNYTVRDGDIINVRFNV